ncbi:hypothetical protein [Nonomuraea typhae]|uniref:hypothetical protein n=1 Tax=Nonomuraea typhae TaxID=2603600 RepID=UPI0012F83348|nr:hypothetical protein [Nonomuraea typhae]
MTAIVGVHGIGKFRYYLEAGNDVARAAEAMRVKWDRYLHAAIGGEAKPYFAEIAYFAHLINDPRPPEAPEAEPLSAPAQMVLAGWAKELGVGEHLTGALKAFAGWLLGRLDGRASAFAKLFCPEVAVYLTDSARRQKARQVVAEVIRRRRPGVVVAHSLGSVVAYEAFWANPDLETDLLITLGSPLGMRNVIFERLLPAPVNGRGERPPGVGRWVNIADKDDIAAIPPELCDSFAGIDEERLVNLDWLDFHTAGKYLGCEAIGPYLRPYLA